MSNEKEVVPVITEEALQKSLTELEGKEEVAAPPVEPKVAIEPLQKTAAQTVAENGSEDMRKALDVSTVLREHVGLMGIHVDQALESLQKSLQSAAERDFAIIRVLEKQNATIESMGKTIAEFGKQPTAPAAMRQTTAAPTDVLRKTAGVQPEGAAKVSRGKVMAGIEKLAKSCAPGTQEMSRWSNAAAKFESTGQISDRDLLDATKAASA